MSMFAAGTPELDLENQNATIFADNLDIQNEFLYNISTLVHIFFCFNN